MKPKLDISALEQAYQAVLDHQVPFYSAMYKRYKAEGLTPQEAMHLTVAYITQPISREEPPPSKDTPS